MEGTIFKVLVIKWISDYSLQGQTLMHVSFPWYIKILD